MRRQANSVAPGYTHLQLNHPFLRAFSTAFTAPGYDHSWAEQQFAAAHTALKTGALHDITYPQQDRRAYDSWTPPEEKQKLQEDHRRNTDQFHREVARQTGLPHPDDFAEGEEDEHGRTKRYMARADLRQAWENGIRRGLTKGHITIDQAEERGYHGDAREHGEQGWPGEPRRGGWRPMPERVFHVGTDADAIAGEGLKTRHELSNRMSGLGGGTDHTVSVTSDPKLGPDIYHSLHEHHAVIRGDISVQQLHDYAKKPPAGQQPFHDRMLAGTGERTLDQQLREVKIHHGMTKDNEPPDEHPGWKATDHVNGTKIPYMWERPQTSEERIRSRSEAYKAFSYARGNSGGHRDPLFLSNNPHAFAQADPAKFGILHLRTHPGAQGYTLTGKGEHDGGADSGEWRTGGGSPFDVEKVDKPRPRHLDEFGLDDKTGAVAAPPRVRRFPGSHPEQLLLHPDLGHGMDEWGVYKGNPQLPLYRGLQVPVHPDALEHLGKSHEHDQDIAHHLMGLIDADHSDRGHKTRLGIHWSHDSDATMDLANQAHRDDWGRHGDDAHPVMIEADHPGHEHVIDFSDPMAAEGGGRPDKPSKDWHLTNDTIGPHNMHGMMLPEVPIRPGAPMHVRAIHVQKPDGDFHRIPVGLRTQAGLDDDDYRMQHRPPDRDGIPMHDMTVNLPDDVYTHPHYYSDMSEPSAQHAHREINRVRGKPDAKVHIYRALPAEHVHQGIRPGDWVTTSKDYARQHGTHAVDPKHDWPVIRATVRAGDLHTDGDDFREFGYNGEEAKRGQVAFKGGYHQEVRQHADGVIRPVVRSQSPVKGYSFTHEDHRDFMEVHGPNPQPPRGVVHAWTKDGDAAGHIRYRDGEAEEVHIAPEHQHLAEELERRMRMKMTKISARAPGKVWYHGTSMEYAQDILDNGARKGLNVVTYQPSANGYARIQGKFHSDSGRAVVLEGHLDGDEEEHPWDRDREGKAHRGIAVTSRPHAFTPTHWHEVLPWERGEEPQTERHPISEPMRKQASTQMVRPSQVWDHIRTDVHPHRLDTIRDSVAHHGWQPDWNVADGPIKVSLDPPVVSNGSHRLHVLRELGRDEPIPMQVSAAKIPDAERTESVQHMLRHYRPTDFDTWHQVRRNINWDHPTVKSFVEDVKRNGVKRPIPVDYEADPPQVMNGHTRLLAAERAGLDSVPTRQHEGFMDPDDPDHMGRGPDDPQHWTNQEHWAKKASGPVLYHGSTQRFEKGTVLTPAQRTDGSIHSGDWVYATTDPESARYFASMHDSSPESDAPVHIHRVEPIGDIEPDGFPSERDRFSRGNYRAKALRVLDHHQVPGHWAKQASLSDEDRVSVAEQAMERGGHTGRSWHVPAMHQDDPARQEAQRPVHDFVNGVLSQYGRGPVRVSPSHWDLRSPGSGRALYDHTYGTIGLAGEDTNDLELLHEMAHAITGKHGHDREFQQAVHGLYRDHLGPEAAKIFVDVAWKGQRHEAVTENWPPHLTEREDKYGDTYPVNVSRSNPRGPVATESEAQAVGLVGPYYHGTSKRRAREIRSGGFRQPRLHNYEMEGAGNAEEVDLGNTHRTYFTDTHDDAMHFAQAHHGQDADVVTAYLHPDHMEHDKGGGWMPSVTVKDVTHATAIRPERKQAARDESELHRGVLLTTRVDELAKAHERGGMPAVHRHLHDLVTTHQQEISRSRSTDPGVGTHWTSDPGVARKFSQGWRFAGDRDSVPHTRSGYNNEVDIPIHLTGRVAPEHHVTDPDELSHHMVEGHGWEQDSIPKFLGQPLPPREQETLVRKGAPVDVTSVRAALPSHPDWVNHLRAAHDNWEHEDWGDQEHSWQTIGGPGHHQATRTTPHDRVFGPTYGLDIRLWKNDKLREPIRADIIARWRTFCLRHNYRDWSTWVKIVFFGSEASEWSGPGQIGNGDFDLSIGIEYERMRAANPAFETMADAEIAQQLTGEMFTELRDPAHVFPDTDGVFDQTWFANVLGWNIAVMRPYAAYDVIAQEWIVRPPHLPDWDLSKMPAPMRTILRAAETTARNTLKLPEPERTLQGARLYEMWHADRSNAFGPQGEGWYDLGNLREKWLDQLDLWAPLYQAHKRAENLQLADWSNTPHFGSMTAKDYEGEVGNRDHITRSEVGTLPVGAVAGLQGVKGERPGEHRHRQGQAWEDFKADIAANGVQKPIFITVDHGQEPRISEGNHRRDASVELGLPDIPAEVRYFGHAEHEGTVEERARYRTAALYHWAPKEYRDDIEQHGLDHTRSPLYNPDGHGPHGIFMHHTPELAHDWAPGVEQTHDLYEVDAQGMKLHPDPYDTGAASYTAQPVPPERIHRVGSTTIRYMRNNGGMRQNMPSGFGQEHEPWGRYMNHYDPDDPGMATDRETGTVEFGNPLHVEHDHGGWKQTLSEAHGGATGRALSDALLARGHDAVITHDKYGIGEIVDLRPRDQRTHVPDRLAALS